MTLTDLQPFSTALQSHRQRQVMPTSLNTRGLQQLDAGVRRTSFFSAETMFNDYLANLKASVEAILNPRTTLGDQGLKTEGMDEATARLAAKKDLLERIGYSPAAGEEGTIKDLSSRKRINLILRTNVDVARGAGWFVQGHDPAALDAYPAQELVRVEDREHQRNWAARFRICAEVIGDTDATRILKETGRMIARKDSPIWQALGDGADGSDDTLGNPFPPFAFNSGMDVRDIGYSEAVKLGLIRDGEAVRPQLPDDLGDLLKEAS